MLPRPTIRTVTAAADVEPVQALLREYADSLGFDLSFQDFERELGDLPGPYAPPSGCLLLATAAGEPAGCVALRKLLDGVCEMKRLYVRSPYRGTGLGRALAERLLGEACRLGYDTMRLDTVPAVMGRAVALYRELGSGPSRPTASTPYRGRCSWNYG